MSQKTFNISSRHSNYGNDMHVKLEYKIFIVTLYVCISNNAKITKKNNVCYQDLNSKDYKKKKLSSKEELNKYYIYI